MPTQPELSAEYVNHQLDFFGGCDISPFFHTALESTLDCFSHLNIKYFDGHTISPLNGDQYVVFLIKLVSTALEAGDAITANKVYLLNKMLHGLEVFYEVELPDVFYLQHPVGTVLGRAKYSNYFYASHNVTVGNNNGMYPTIGERVSILAGATVIGNTTIGNNVVVSSRSYLKDEKVPDNCLVFGSTPSIIIVQKDEHYMQRFFSFFPTPVNNTQVKTHG